MALNVTTGNIIIFKIGSFCGDPCTIIPAFDGTRVDLTRWSLLTACPNISMPYNILCGFDMKERNVPALYCASAQGKYVRDIHILVGEVQARQEEDTTANIPYLPPNHLCPVYATISPPHQSEGERRILNLRTLRMTVGDSCRVQFLIQPLVWGGYQMGSKGVADIVDPQSSLIAV